MQPTLNDPPAARVLDAHRVDPRIPDATAAVAARLIGTGIAALDGFRSREAVLAFARQVMTVLPHRDSEPDGLTVIKDTHRHGDRPGYAGFGSGGLAPHTERSSLPQPPRLMLLVCLQRADRGGDSELVDGRAVLRDLARSAPEAVDALTADRAAFFGGRDGIFAPVFSTKEGRAAVRLRLDELVRWHPATRAHIPLLRACLDRHTQRLPLGPGQGYLLDNHWWLHARRPFQGSRLCYRALGEPRFKLPPGFPIG